MNPSKNIQFVVKIGQSMTISHGRHFSLIRKFCEFIVREAEGPEIIETAFLIFSTKKVDSIFV